MNPSLLGNKRLVKLKYHDGVVLVGSVLGAPSTQVFSANGMFDPNITGVGHQPRGFDQIMPLFQHYTVISSKCTATFMPVRDIPAFADSLAVVASVVLRRSAVVLSDQRGVLEDRNVTFVGTGNSISAEAVRISRGFNPKTFIGISHPMSEANLRGNAATNPTEESFFHVSMVPIGFATSAGTWQVSVDIMYIAVFTEPRQPVES